MKTHINCMDGKNSEVGESWGRTGKSLFGVAIGKVVPQAYIGAKNKNLTEDPFWAEEVTEKIDNIFLDDVRANLDFEFFFPVITGRITINVKGQKKFTLSENDTPKLLITTNHSIAGESSSYRDRQMLVAFSDYYNDKRKPIDDFKVNFWVEWEADQWNLFYNMMANCIQLYFTYGLVEAPMERLEMRRMRQFMGEDFLTWTNEYFGTSDEESADLIYGSMINTKISRREMFNDFLDKNPVSRKYMTATKFKKKITSFCKYKGLVLNPHIVDEATGSHGGDDKSGGVRQGESAIRDGKIHMSCQKGDAECGQGWYQTGLDSDLCSTLAPLLHWRVCGVWDWLKIFAPGKKYGEWPTAILADAYGGDEAEEIAARTGCIGCPLASKDKSLMEVLKIPAWKYLSPLMELKPIYREMKKPQHRHRKPGGEKRKDGKLSSNQQRLGPLTISARLYFLDRIIDIQNRINSASPDISFSLINQEEEKRIRELIEQKVYPNKWTGEEPTGDIMLDKKYKDGSTMSVLFTEMIGKPA